MMARSMSSSVAVGTVILEYAVQSVDGANRQNPDLAALYYVPYPVPACMDSASRTALGSVV